MTRAKIEEVRPDVVQLYVPEDNLLLNHCNDRATRTFETYPYNGETFVYERFCNFSSQVCEGLKGIGKVLRVEDSKERLVDVIRREYHRRYRELKYLHQD